MLSYQTIHPHLSAYRKDVTNLIHRYFHIYNFMIFGYFFLSPIIGHQFLRIPLNNPNDLYHHLRQEKTAKFSKRWERDEATLQWFMLHTEETNSICIREGKILTSARIFPKQYKIDCVRRDPSIQLWVGGLQQIKRNT